MGIINKVFGAKISPISGSIWFISKFKDVWSLPFFSPWKL